MSLVVANESDVEQTESFGDELKEMWCFGLGSSLTHELKVSWNAVP